MINFIDSLFDPVLQLLNMMIDRLAGIGTVAAKGIYLDHYFGFFNVLGPSWKGVISSLITSLIFLFILYMIQKYSRSIVWLKSLIKWWG